MDTLEKTDELEELFDLNLTCKRCDNEAVWLARMICCENRALHCNEHRAIKEQECLFRSRLGWICDNCEYVGPEGEYPVEWIKL